jgi:ABC-2 type transport system permease protein
MTLENGFDRIEERGWRLGFVNLLARENRKWWGSNRWWIQSLIWLVILGSFVAMVLFVIPGLASPDGQPAMEMEPIMGALQGFFGVGAVALALGITVLMQDELITEKQLGTAEWVLSKPVSRSAFLLAKLVAHTSGMLVVMIAVPSAGVYALLAIYAGAPYSLAPFLAGVGLLALHTFFYLCLALVLGVLAERRELLLAVSLASLLGGSFIRDFIPRPALFTPWFLPDVAGLAAMGLSIPAELAIPVLATFIWAVVFIVVALRAFRRHEF